MMSAKTTYRIHLTSSLAIETDSAYVAEMESEVGYRVTAITEVR